MMMHSPQKMQHFGPTLILCIGMACLTPSCTSAKIGTAWFWQGLAQCLDHLDTKELLPGASHLWKSE